MRSPAFSISIPLQPAPRLKRPAQGLLLDACDTLYDATGWRRWLLQILRRQGLHTHYGLFFHVWEKDYLDAVHRGQRDPSEALRTFLLALGLSRGQVDEVALTCEARRRRWEAETRLLPGVRRTLSQIAAAGIPLAVVSDTERSSREVREHLEKRGLRNAIQTVVTSKDLGRTKPDPACYQAALDALAMGPDQVAFVGHDGEELAGAARLGIQTIAFNSTSEVAADVCITRFDELIELVDQTIWRSVAG